MEAIMRQSFFKFTVLALATVFLSLSTILADEPANVNWDQFSKGLNMALKSDNLGVKLSAMQLVIKYGNKVDVKDARYDVMDTFLYSKDRRVRQLALVTLSKINNTFRHPFTKVKCHILGSMIRITRNFSFFVSYPFGIQIIIAIISDH